MKGYQGTYITCQNWSGTYMGGNWHAWLHTAAPSPSSAASNHDAAHSHAQGLSRHQSSKPRPDDATTCATPSADEDLGMGGPPMHGACPPAQVARHSSRGHIAHSSRARHLHARRPLKYCVHCVLHRSHQAHAISTGTRRAHSMQPVVTTRKHGRCPTRNAVHGTHK